MSRARDRRAERGMTLTELLVVTVVMVALVGLVFESFRFHGLTFRTQSDRGALQGDLRVWAARMMLDIRNAGYDPLGTAFSIAALPVQTATPTDFEWQSDADANGSIQTTNALEYRGYRLNNGALQLRQGSDWRTVVTGVTNLVFTYWDLAGSPVNQTSPYTRYGDIAVVKFTISAQAPNDPATSVTESGSARIRNPETWKQ